MEKETWIVPLLVWCNITGKRNSYQFCISPLTLQIFNGCSWMNLIIKQSKSQACLSVFPLGFLAAGNREQDCESFNSVSEKSQSEIELSLSAGWWATYISPRVFAQVLELSVYSRHVCHMDVKIQCQQLHSPSHVRRRICVATVMTRPTSSF